MGATRTALGILAAHNLVQNLALNERGYVAGNLAVSGLLVGLGQASGLSWEEMGVHPGDLRRGLRIGVRAGAVGAAVGLVALSNPRTRVFFLDERAAASSDRGVWRRALIRFPLGTALFEEMAFRGVLPALLRQTHRAGWAEALSAGAFGLWHLIPTGRALSGNPLGHGMSGRRRVAVILGGSVAAGMSGLALSRLRRETGSLLSSWMVHTSFNSLSYLAGVAALHIASAERQNGLVSSAEYRAARRLHETLVVVWLIGSADISSWTLTPSRRCQ